MPDITRIDGNQRRSRMVVHKDVVYLAGQVADDARGDIAAQTSEALAKIDDLLSRAGTSKDNLLSAQIWLADMADFPGMNAVWDNWVAPDNAPTRCCGEVKLADPAYRVEIVVTAAR
ncbi:RidA family protein [Rhizobium puerariae]|uniref:RidA family protein n=1 Tax=Rhizobium puerariae TaxID=1585791 RepID=A0ABV6AF62_9HYPH